MSEHEFDAYLALLGGMLGLSDEQREAISGELRDHMLERMHEQMAAGVPRDEAIQRALAEFGDASRLAAGLAAAATLHRRRLILRWTFGTVVTFGLLLFIGLAYWPAGENGPGPQTSVGQSQNVADAIQEDTPEPTVRASANSVQEDVNERAFRALETPIAIDVTASVEQIIGAIAAKANVRVEDQLPNDGSDEEIEHLKKELSIKLEGVPALTALRVAAQDRIGFVLQDGMLRVVAKHAEAHRFQRIYPVSDLLALHAEEPFRIKPSGYAQLRRLVEERRRLLLNAKVDEARGYDDAVVAAAEELVREAETTRNGLPKLARVLQDIVFPGVWDVRGGQYSMQSYGNTIVVSASLPIHWELTQTLAGLRKHALRSDGPASGAPSQPGESIDDAESALGANAQDSLLHEGSAIPPYVIEPPDILKITALKTVPKPPYKLRPFDLIIIRVLGVFEDVGEPIADAYSIQPDGTVDLGPTYGKAKVVGLSVEEATAAIEKHLKQFVPSPKVAVSVAAAGEIQSVDGQYLVGPDGRVNLGSYGQVYVSGKTIVEAKAAIEEKLAVKLEDPEVVVDVFAYNSKVYYVITQGDGRGDNVVRVAITGNETVLDAISKLGGIRRVSSKTIWIARPSPKGVGASQELPVDWNAITRDAVTATNYQVLPGDRIFISEKNPEVKDEPLPPREVPFDATRF